MRRLIAAVVIVAGLAAGCTSNTVDSKPVGNGLCEQTTKRKFLGITTNTDRSRINCDQEG